MRKPWLTMNKENVFVVVGGDAANNYKSLTCEAMLRPVDRMARSDKLG